jgi:hypothetical protein
MKKEFRHPYEKELIYEAKLFAGAIVITVILALINLIFI